MNPLTLTVCFWQSPLLGGPLKRIEEAKQGAIIVAFSTSTEGAVPKSHFFSFMIQLLELTGKNGNKKVFTFSGAGPGSANTTSPAKLDKQQVRGVGNPVSFHRICRSRWTPIHGSKGSQFSSFRFDLLSNRTCLSMDPGKFGFVGTSSWANSPRFKDTYNVRLVGAGFKA